MYGTTVLLALTGGWREAAADTARVTKAPPATIVMSPWSGFYAGVNVGYGVGHNDGSESINSPTAGAAPLTAQHFTLAPTDWLAGVQAGYNWQFAPKWVAGVEADWQWTNQRDSLCITFCTSNFAGNPFLLMIEQRLTWLTTLRGRFGYLFGSSLLYVTGGAASGRVTHDASLNIVGTPAAASFQHTRTGWTVGGGIETSISAGWTAKLEYLYVDLGTVTDTLTIAPLSQTISYPIRDHIVRLGLNRHFDTGKPLASASSVPAQGARVTTPATWTGFYAGINGGYGAAANGSSELFTFGGAPATSQQFTLGPAGALVGIQAGYNWQFAPNWVAGVEADWQWSNQSDSVCISACTTNLGNGGTSFMLTIEQNLNWLATARGRVGYAKENWLLYVTGGAAWARTTENIQFNTLAGTFSHTKGGFAAGAGAESRIAGNWTAKLEYLYADLGTVTDTISSPPATVNETISIKVKDHVIRAGLNYAF